jgi:TolB-like protein/Tfp pilus assembly protein PilF
MSAESFGAPEWVMQMLLVILAIGLPVTLVLAWSFELTPAGIKRDSEVEPGARSSGGTLNKLLLGLLVTALTYFIWESRFQTPTDSTGVTNTTASQNTEADAAEELEKSIAVLPFENFSTSDSDQFFADGLADTLLHKLAQIKELKVIARNSSFQFKGSNRDIREIGEILGVRTVLEGSVQRAGNQVRIIAQLINASDGVHLWSQSFDGEMDNIFSLQDDVAHSIVEQLQLTLSREERDRLLKSSTNNPRAFELLMEANNTDWDFEGMQLVDETTYTPVLLIEEALELDPEYAAAWATLSFEFNFLAFGANNNDDFERFQLRQRAAAQEALRLDPELDLAYEALGWTEFRVRNLNESIRNFRRAIDLNPNSGGAMAGLGLALLGIDSQESFELFKRNIELDPNGGYLSYRQASFALQGLNRPSEALDYLQRGLEIDPSAILLYVDIAELYIENYGLPVESARWLSRALAQRPDSAMAAGSMSDAWAAAGDMERAENWLVKAVSGHEKTDRQISSQAGVLMISGQYAEAAELLEKVPPGFYSRFLSMPRGTLCLLLSQVECAASHAQDLNKTAAVAAAQGNQRFYNSAQMQIFNAIVAFAQGQDQQARLLTQDLTETLATWPVFAPFGMPNRAYMEAGALALLGRKAEAIVALEETLGLADGGFISTDFMGLPPGQSLMLISLHDEPGFEDWLDRFEARKTAMREAMINLEKRGEIAVAGVVAEQGAEEGP